MQCIRKKAQAVARPGGYWGYAVALLGPADGFNKEAGVQCKIRGAEKGAAMLSKYEE